MSGATPRQGRVLLVEDDALSLKLMKDVLEANGYQVDQSTNGVDGLAMARQRAPDLIVMDIGLPAMDGVEVTRWLKADPAVRSVPVLAVTAYAMPGDEERMRSAGCDAFLTKPLRFGEFVSVVGRLLAEHGEDHAAC
jgi:two-component system cell cycle response regulator DivK